MSEKLDTYVLSTPSPARNTHSVYWYAKKDIALGLCHHMTPHLFDKAVPWLYDLQGWERFLSRDDAYMTMLELNALDALKEVDRE